MEQKNYRLGSHFFLSLQFFFCASFFFSLFRNEKNEINFSFLSFLSFIFKKKTSNDLSFVFKKKTDNDHFLSLLELLPLLLPKANSKKKDRTLNQSDLHLFFEGLQRFGLEEFWLENSNLILPSSFPSLFRDDHQSKFVARLNPVSLRTNQFVKEKETDKTTERSGVSMGFAPSILQTRIHLIITHLGFWSSYLGDHPLALTSVFSPYKGEVVEVPPLYSIFEKTTTKKNIIKIKKTINDRRNELVGQNKQSLFLRSTDQTSFYSEQSKPRVNVGQLIRCGSQKKNKNNKEYNNERSPDLTLSESGQVIEIEKNKIKLRRAQPIPALLNPLSTSLFVTDGDFVKRDQPILTTFYQGLTTEDIVQGIPKIEQLFEGRRTKKGLPFSGNLPDRLDDFFLSELNKPDIFLKEAAFSSLAIIQRLLIDKIQNVYISQGVLIADKHLEIVIRQMTSKVVILADGFDEAALPYNKPWFLPGEFVYLEDAANLSAVAHPIGLRLFHKPPLKQTLIYKPIILGVTTASLESDSFFSSASFQETTRILSSSSVKGRKDFLHGLKERVILGDLISVGTGSVHLIPSLSSPVFSTKLGVFTFFDSTQQLPLTKIKVEKEKITTTTYRIPSETYKGLTREIFQPDSNFGGPKSTLLIDESVFALLSNNISNIREERRAQIQAVFAQRKIIVDQIFKILSPIKYAKKARKQPIQELKGVLGIRFDPTSYLKLLSYLEQKQKGIERGGAE